MALTRLDAIELDDLLKAAGFDEAERRRVAWGVAMRESRGTPGIVSAPNQNGSRDWGLFQFNDRVWATHADVDWSRILTGSYNAELAHRLTDGGVNWSTWGLGDDGWAGSLKRSNYETWLQVQRDFKTQYDAYPAAMQAALDLRTHPPVYLALLKPGLRNEDVRTFQNALRKYLGKAAETLNPSGATGFYGNETRTMTKAAYALTARTTGANSWLSGDTTVPGPSLIMRLGLRVAS